MKYNLKTHCIKIFVCLFIFIVTAFSVDAENEIRKYELYNMGSYVDITSFLVHIESGEINKPIEYININELYKIGLQVTDVDGGISITGNKRSAYVYFEKPSKIGIYTFDEPFVMHGSDIWIKLDVIGKCFSFSYSGELYGDVWRIYIDTGASVSRYEYNSMVVNSCVYNFKYNVYSLSIENHSYCGFNNVKIYTAYYGENEKLLDIDISDVYKVGPKDSFTTFVPINQYYHMASKVKIMIWDGNLPLLDVIIPKDFKLELTNLPPEDIKDREKVYPDVDIDNKYYDAIYVVSNNFDKIGLPFMYDDRTFKPNNYVMKNEFAYSLNRIIGNDFRINEFENIEIDCNIADIEQTNWCKDEIGYLVSMDIMPLSNGYFFPLNNIRLDEALYAYLKVLGESDLKNDQILELSQKYNLLENINYSRNVITREVYAQLLYNFSKEYVKQK